MRNRLFCLCISVSIALLAWTGTAHANSISLIWQTSGTATTSVIIGQTVTADVVLSVSGAGNPRSIVWSIAFDSEVTEVSATGSCGSDFCTTPVGGGTNWEHFTILGQGPDGDAPNPGPSFESSWGIFTGLGDPSELSIGTATVGTITFSVKNLYFDGIDVLPGFLNSPAGDGCADTDNTFACSDDVTFNGASLNGVPEPGTLALLALGLAALGAVARRGL